LPGLEQYEALTAFALWGKIGFAERPLNATPVPVAGNNVDWYPRGLRRVLCNGLRGGALTAHSLEQLSGRFIPTGLI
jgi:hypothetical protein